MRTKENESTNKYLRYSVNVDFDCMIDEGWSLSKARDWFDTEEAKESYEDDWEDAKAVAQQVFEARMN